MPSKRQKIKVETWGKLGHVFVIRNDVDKILAWRRKKGSGLTLKSATSLYKKNNSLRKEEQITRLRRVSEHVITSKSRGAYFKGRPGGTGRIKTKAIQYFVSGTYKNKEFAARSLKIDPNGLVTNKNQAYKNAWESFLMQISKAAGGKYDADEGYNYIDDIKNIKEGWVYYA